MSDREWTIKNEALEPDEPHVSALRKLAGCGNPRHTPLSPCLLWRSFRFRLRR